MSKKTGHYCPKQEIMTLFFCIRFYRMVNSDAISRLILTNNGCFEQICVARMSKRNTNCKNNDISFFDITVFFSCFCSVKKKNLHAVFLFGQEWRYTPDQVHLTPGTFIRSTCNDLGIPDDIWKPCVQYFRNG